MFVELKSRIVKAMLSMSISPTQLFRTADKYGMETMYEAGSQKIALVDGHRVLLWSDEQQDFVDTGIEDTNTLYFFSAEDVL